MVTPRGGARRDYAALAGIAGYSREQYEQLHPRAQREARLEIDRELALRRELRGAAGAVVAAGERAPGRRERRRAEQDFDGALDEGLRRGRRTPRRAPEIAPRAASAPAMSHPTARLGPIHLGAPAAASSPRCCATPTRSRGGANASWGADG